MTVAQLTNNLVTEIFSFAYIVKEYHDFFFLLFSSASFNLFLFVCSVPLSMPKVQFPLHILNKEVPHIFSKYLDTRIITIFLGSAFVFGIPSPPNKIVSGLLFHLFNFLYLLFSIFSLSSIVSLGFFFFLSSAFSSSLFLSLILNLNFLFIIFFYKCSSASPSAYVVFVISVSFPSFF